MTEPFKSTRTATDMATRTQFEVSNARCDQLATVTVFRDRTGAVVLATQPWATQVRFTPDQLAALVDHLVALRDEVFSP